MRKGRVNWNLIIVLFLAVVAVAITSIGLRKYHRNQRMKIGLQEGLAAYEDGRWGQAASYLGQYLAINSNDVEILIKYAQSHMRIQPFKRDSLAQAINAYRVALRQEDNAQAAEELIKLYLRFGMPAEAELIAQRFLEKDPDNQFHQSLALALVRQRKYEQAVTVLNDLLQRVPGQIVAYKLMGEIAEKRPELTTLTPGQWYDKAVQENVESAQAYILRSGYLMEQEKYQLAVKDLEQAEQCDLSDVNTRLSLAATWLRQRQFERAKSHLEAVRQTNPDNEGLWQIWAAMAGDMADTEAMVFVADQGIEALGPENYNFLELAAELYVKANRIERAQECVDQLTAVDAERSTVLYLEGLIAQSKNQWTLAINSWQQAIQLGYSSELIYLNLADTLELINNRPMAIQLLRRYISQNEGAFRGHLRLSQFFAKDRNWQEALEQATAAMQLNPVSLEARVLYLRCRIELMDTAKEADASVIRQAIDHLLSVNDSLPGRMLLYYWASRLGQYAQAGEILDGIEQTFGPGESIAISRARLLMLKGQQAEAFALLETAYEQYPESGEIVQLLAWSYSRSKQYDKAIEFLKKASQAIPDAYNRRQCQLWTAEVLTLAGRADDAVTVYLDMAKENASDIFVRRQLLSSQLQSGDVELLQQWVDEIKAAEGEDGWQWKYEQSRLWFARSDDFQRYYSDIVKMLNENISINAEDQASRILLASSHERAGNIQLAISLYQDATPRQSENIDFIIAAVGTMYRAQEFRQAQALLARAAERGIWDSRLAQYELRNTLRTGTQDSAMSILEKMTAESPDDSSARLSLAILQIRNDQLDQARDNIESVLNEDPDSVGAIAAMADLYLKQNKPEQALKVCDEYIQHYNLIQGHLIRCQVLLAMKDNAAVEEGIATIESNYRDDHTAMLAVAQLYTTIGKTQKSIEILTRLLAEEPDDYAVQKQAAVLFLQQSDPALRKQGQELLTAALAMNPVDVQLRLAQSQSLMQEGTAVSIRKAENILLSLSREYPKLEAAWVGLGQIALIRNNVQIASDYTLRGLSYVPDSRPLLLLRAGIESKGSPDKAVAVYQQLYEKIPQDATVAVLLSQSYCQQGQYAKALALLQDSLSDDLLKSSEALENEQVTVLYEMGRSDDAAAHYRELIKRTDEPSVLLNWIKLLAKDHAPDDLRQAYQQWSDLYPDAAESVLSSVLDTLLAMQHPDKVTVAEQILHSLLQQRPDSAVVSYSMAMLLHMTGRKVEAIPWYEKTLAQNPEQPVAMNNLAWILSTEKSQHQQALKYAQQGLAIKPSYVDLIDTRGTIYMRLGEYKKAAEDFQRCRDLYFEKNPNRTVSIFHLGKCLLETGERQKALLELTNAKDLDAMTGGLSEQQKQQINVLIRQASEMN